MALELFKVGNTDYTNNIINGTFNVKKNDVAGEWTDANWTDKKDPVRTRVEGSFTMKFRTLGSYEAFVADLASNKSSGLTYPCTVWCTNSLTHETGNFFLDFDAVAEQKPNLVMNYVEFELNVKEA